MKMKRIMIRRGTALLPLAAMAFALIGPSVTQANTGALSTGPLTIEVPGGVPAFHLIVSDNDPTTPDASVQERSLENLKVTLESTTSEPFVINATKKMSLALCPANARVNQIIDLVLTAGTSLSVDYSFDRARTTDTTPQRSEGQIKSGVADTARSYSISLCVR